MCNQGSLTRKEYRELNVVTTIETWDDVYSLLKFMEKYQVRVAFLRDGDKVFTFQELQVMVKDRAGEEEKEEEEREIGSWE